MSKGTILYEPATYSAPETFEYDQGAVKKLSRMPTHQFVRKLRQLLSRNRRSGRSDNRKYESEVGNPSIVVYSSGAPRTYNCGQLNASKITVGNNVDNDICVQGSYHAGEIRLNLTRMTVKVLRPEVWSNSGELYEKGRVYPIQYGLKIWMGGVPIVIQAPRMERRKA